MRAMMLTAALLVATMSSPVLAHGGGLDRNGGHHNRKTGEYHCHREPCFSNRKKEQEKPKERPPKKDQQGDK